MKRIPDAANLKHAIGEVLLIVIGVLIALAVESWWSDRTDKARSTELLRALEAEWSTEIERLDLKIAEFDRAKSGMIEVINAHEMHQSSITPSQAIESFRIGKWATFKPMTAALSVLLAEGLRNVDDPPLEMAIATWPTHLEEIRPEQEALHDLAFFHLRRARADLAHEIGKPYAIVDDENPHFWYGVEPEEFVVAVFADDEYVAVIRHILDIAEDYLIQLQSVRKALESNLYLLRNHLAGSTDS